MSAVVTNDADLFTDLEILALSEPGKGQALKRIIDRSGFTLKAMADKLGYDPNTDTGRVTLSHWVSERRWPPAATIRELLTHCAIDRKVLLDKFGIALGTEVTPISESRQMLVNLRNELQFEFDAFERRDIIFSNTAEKVLLFQAFKAFDDVRAAQLFFERYDKHQEEKRTRNIGNARNVSPAQSQAVAGDVYQVPAKSGTVQVSDNAPTTGSGTPSIDETLKPAPALSPDDSSTTK